MRRKHRIVEVTRKAALPKIGMNKRWRYALKNANLAVWEAIYSMKRKFSYEIIESSVDVIAVNYEQYRPEKGTLRKIASD